MEAEKFIKMTGNDRPRKESMEAHVESRPGKNEKQKPAPDKKFLSKKKDRSISPILFEIKGFLIFFFFDQIHSLSLEEEKRRLYQLGKSLISAYDHENDD